MQAIGLTAGFLSRRMALLLLVGAGLWFAMPRASAEMPARAGRSGILIGEPRLEPIAWWREAAAGRRSLHGTTGRDLHLDATIPPGREPHLRAEIRATIRRPQASSEVGEWERWYRLYWRWLASLEQRIEAGRAASAEAPDGGALRDRASWPRLYSAVTGLDADMPPASDPSEIPVPPSLRGLALIEYDGADGRPVFRLRDPRGYHLPISMTAACLGAYPRRDAAAPTGVDEIRIDGRAYFVRRSDVLALQAEHGIAVGAPFLRRYLGEFDAKLRAGTRQGGPQECRGRSGTISIDTGLERFMDLARQGGAADGRALAATGMEIEPPRPGDQAIRLRWRMPPNDGTATRAIPLQVTLVLPAWWERLDLHLEVSSVDAVGRSRRRDARTFSIALPTDLPALDQRLLMPDP
jgi:hypothetical protein